MNISEIRVTSIQFERTYFELFLNNGERLKIPYTDWTSLKVASSDQRENYKLLSNGVGIHWSEIDEDLSVSGLLKRYG